MNGEMPTVPLWETPPADPPPAPKSMTLDQYLFALEQDDDDALDGVLPEHVLGGMKEKVDGIRHKLRLWEFQSRFLRDEAAKLTETARKLDRRHERLEDYVKWVMLHRKFDELPGLEFKVKLRVNPEAMSLLKTEADALDFEKYPAYCEQVRFYQWKKPEIKSALQAGEKIPFAKLTRGHRIEFGLNLPTEIPAGTTKGKRK